jgi:hypothetical protein
MEKVLTSVSRSTRALSIIEKPFVKISCPLHEAASFVAGSIEQCADRGFVADAAHGFR